MRHLPGDGWTFVVRPGLVVGIEPEGSGRARAVWDGPATAAAALDELTRSGISSAPSFVLIAGTPAGPATVMVRGATTARVRTADGELEVDGTDRTGWAEQHISAFAGAAWGADDAGDALPIVEGIVRARGFEIGERIEVADGSALGAFEPEARQPEGRQPAAPEPAAPEPAVPDPAGSEPVADPSQTVEGVTLVAPADRDPEESPITEAAASGYDHLFGATVSRSVERAAVRPDAEAEEPAVDPSAIEDRTSVAADLETIRARRRAARRAAASAPTTAAYWLELSTGSRERLDQPLVIGRAPVASSVAGEAVPRLVTMTTPNQDISRTHVRIHEHDGTVVVTDLHSRNGTIVTMPGKPPQRLREGEPTVVISGTVIDLGDGATLTVREDA